MEPAGKEKVPRPESEDREEEQREEAVCGADEHDEWPVDASRYRVQRRAEASPLERRGLDDPLMP